LDICVLEGLDQW